MRSMWNSINFIFEKWIKCFVSYLDLKTTSIWSKTSFICCKGSDDRIKNDKYLNIIVCRIENIHNIFYRVRKSDRPTFEPIVRNFIVFFMICIGCFFCFLQKYMIWFSKKIAILLWNFYPKPSKLGRGWKPVGSEPVGIWIASVAI